MFADFSKNPYPEMEEQMRMIEECGPENYFKGLTQATFEPENDRLIWELMEEKGLESVSYTHLDVYKRQRWSYDSYCSSQRCRSN